MGLGAMEVHHCWGLQRHGELPNKNKRTVARKRGDEGDPRGEGSPAGSPHCPSHGRPSTSTCCSEQVAGLRGDATLYSCIRIVSPLKLTHGTTKMTVLSPGNCVISLFQQGFHPKIEWRVLEKSHILHLTLPRPWKLKQNMLPPFNKKSY